MQLRVLVLKSILSLYKIYGRGYKDNFLQLYHGGLFEGVFEGGSVRIRVFILIIIYDQFPVIGIIIYEHYRNYRIPKFS